MKTRSHLSNLNSALRFWVSHSAHELLRLEYEQEQNTYKQEENKCLDIKTFEEDEPSLETCCLALGFILSWESCFRSEASKSSLGLVNEPVSQ